MANTQFGSFFNKPLGDLLAFPNHGHGTDAAYWRETGVSGVGKMLSEIQRKAGGLILSDVNKPPHGWDWSVVAKAKFTFINHGAFGVAMPPLLKIAEYFTALQQKQPLVFFDRLLFPFLAYAVRRMRRFLSCEPGHTLLLFPNATYGLNLVMRNLTRRAEPEGKAPSGSVVLFTTTYGAVKKMAAHYYGKNVTLVQAPLDSLVSTWKCEDDVVSWLRTVFAEGGAHAHALQPGVTVLLESISSNTAIRWPYCKMAAAIKSAQPQSYVVVDAAHELGMWGFSPPNMRDVMPADTDAPSVDAWVSNGHKWFGTPSGVGLMVYHARIAAVLSEPLVVSHGSDGVQALEGMTLWHGHVNYAPWMTLPWACNFWEMVAAKRPKWYAALFELAQRAEGMLCDIWHVKPSVAPCLTAPLMRLVPLPPSLVARYPEASDLQNVLHQRYRIEVPVKKLDGGLFVRISVSFYNTLDDYRRLAAAVRDIVSTTPHARNAKL